MKRVHLLLILWCAHIWLRLGNMPVRYNRQKHVGVLSVVLIFELRVVFLLVLLYFSLQMDRYMETHIFCFSKTNPRNKNIDKLIILGDMTLFLFFLS